MAAVLSYSLSVSLVVLLLFPVLHLIVNLCTSFRFNRVVILCGIILSLVLPIISCLGTSNIFHADESTVQSFADMKNQVLPIAIATHGDSLQSFYWIEIAVLIYFGGIFVTLGIESLSFLRLFKLLRKCDKKVYGRYILCRLNNTTVAPFSWGKYIFLHDPEYKIPDGYIYIHEKAHSDSQHWIDLFLADLFCIMLWYNPFAWFTRRLLRLNHEFEADSAVIQSGTDIYEYQKAIILNAMEKRSLMITNSFAVEKRDFRKRVMSISRKRSSWGIKTIVLLSLPALTISTTLISSPLYASYISSISNFQFNNRSVNTIIEYPIPPKTDFDDKTSDSPSDEIISDGVTVLPSPIQNQVPLANIITHALAENRYDKDQKLQLNIEIDLDGEILQIITVPHDADITQTIDDALKNVRFEKTLDNGNPISLRLSFPIRIYKES